MRFFVITIPAIVFQEGKWFILYCPLLDISSQGKTVEEARENMEDLIEHYLKDPDT
ncbi:MAG: type II toxin-antitoxin system HicB family antitoxin [Methanosarcinales archaeon]